MKKLGSDLGAEIDEDAGSNKLLTKSITDVMKIDVTDKQKVINYFMGRMLIKTMNDYKPAKFIEIIIAYKFYTKKNSNITIESYYGDNSIFEKLESQKELNTEKISNYDIPITTNFYK